jgi:hypothetical protein
MDFSLLSPTIIVHIILLLFGNREFVLQVPQMRHPFSALKGFRKFFKTMSYMMVATNVEYMIGHIHGVAAHYYRAESVIDLVMQDYAKAIDDLTNQGCFRANSGVSDINGSCGCIERDSV